MNELAHHYKAKGVRFIGVSVMEWDTKLFKPFVDEMGDEMDYGVALDAVPADAAPDDGAMAKTWMRAAEEGGIPTAFVVHDGRISWIGHPSKLDAPPARIVAGDRDLGDMAEKRLAMKLRERKKRVIWEKGTVIRKKVFPLYDAGEYKAAIAALDEATSSDPELAEGFAWLKFAAFCNGGDIESGLKLAPRLLEDNWDDAEALNHCFCKVISPKHRDEPDPRIARIVLRAARRAVELSDGEQPGYLDTLAEAQNRTGDAKGAVATAEMALGLVEGETKGLSDSLLTQFRDRLERFRRAASEKPDDP